MSNIKYKYTPEELIRAVIKSMSYAEVLRMLNVPWSGGNQMHLKKKIEKLAVDTSHFKHQGWSKGQSSSLKKSWQEVLVLRPQFSGRAKSYVLRRALEESGVAYECAKCQINVWNDKELGLEVDHVNSQNWDDRKENLQFLCPNCHSQKTAWSRLLGE